MRRRIKMTVLAVVMGAATLMGITAGSTILASKAGASLPTTTYTLQGSRPYKPHPPWGGTDDYHCTLVNPHVQVDSMITASHFFPNSKEVHHAILFLVPPYLAKQAIADDHGGKGWTCFGESVLPGSAFSTSAPGAHTAADSTASDGETAWHHTPGAGGPSSWHHAAGARTAGARTAGSISEVSPTTSISNTPWLAAWAPGHGKDVVPAGTGTPFPKGSLVVMQEHYNLLVGDKPVRSKLVLTTVKAAGSHLKPLSLDLLPAPPDIPCPAGVTGPLCSRAASLANIGKTFGQSQVDFVNALESICGRNPADPPASDTTSCTWPVTSGTIVRLGAHMHYLGRTMKIVLNPGTPTAKTLLYVKDYNFDYQRSYDVKPVVLHPGDHIGVTCTYDPTLRQELPLLRRLPPRFVTWGDGTSEEMCLALVSTIPTTTS